MAKSGTNMNPTGSGNQVPFPPDPSHPPQIMPLQPKGGPYYKQPGASSGKKA